MVPAAEPPAGWEIEHVGRTGGLAVSILGRFPEGEEGTVGIRWSFQIDESPAREQLASLRFLAAVHQRGELIVWDRSEAKQLMREANEPLPVDEDLPRLISLFSDIVVIEDWVGFDLSVPREISAEELERVAFTADAIRSRRTPFRAKHFDLVGDAAAIPHLMTGANMAIGEAWFVEILGQELELGRRTVHFRPKVVHHEGEVEPGRHAVQIEPDDKADPDGLFWEIEAPRELGQAEEAA